VDKRDGDQQPALPGQADVVIVGGGIVGCASAYQLARRGLGVLLLEKGEIAGEQSGRNLGFVRQQGRDPAELPLAAAANRIWQTLQAELDADIEWVQGGNLALAFDEVEAAGYREWARIGAEFGLDTRLLSEAAVREVLPGITTAFTLGIHTPSDGHADPVKATLAFADAAIGAGARIVTGCTVDSIEVAGGRVIGVQTNRGSVRTEIAVCAAGIWSHKLLAGIGLDLPQQAVKVMVLRTQPVKPLTQSGVWTRKIAFRQAVSGSLVASASVFDIDLDAHNFRHLRMFMPMYLANRGRFRLRVGAKGLRSLLPQPREKRFSGAQPEATRSFVRGYLERLEAWFPSLGPLQLEKSWAGLTDGTPDGVPVLEAVERPRGLIVATGQSGHGFALGPVFGQVVADLASKGEAQFDLKAMRLSRFANGTYGQPKSII
jgi:glycine/D-amino acid oxidase-like deaminating enzyme